MKRAQGIEARGGSKERQSATLNQEFDDDYEPVRPQMDLSHHDAEPSMHGNLNISSSSAATYNNFKIG